MTITLAAKKNDINATSFFLRQRLFYRRMKIEIIDTPIENGLNETIRQMKLLELKAIEHRAFNNFCKKTFAKYFYNYHTLFRRLHDFILFNFTYKKDDYDETISAPYVLLQTKQGDCDDFALFAKSVLTCLGIPASFVLCGKSRDEFSHVLVLADGKFYIDGTNKIFNSVNFSRYPYCVVV